MSRLVFENGPVYPMDRPGGADWVLVTRGERIDFVGRRDELAMESGDRHIDLAGRPLLPGFCDSHLHLVLASQAFAGLDLRDVSSADAIAERVRTAARDAPPGQWLVGVGWEKKRIFETLQPSLQDADAMAPDHPLFLISRDLHSAWLNSPALERFDALKARPPKCVPHVLDDQRTGLVHESILELRELLFDDPSPEQAGAWLEQMVTRLHACGITTVHTNEPAADLDLVRDALTASARRVRVLWNFVFDTPEELRANAGRFAESVPGWLQTGGVKLFLDGSFGSLTAAVGQPYRGSRDDHGILNLDDAELDAWLAAIHDVGRYGVFHAIGDRAIAQLLERLKRFDWPPGTRHRIEHGQLLSADILERLRFDDLVFSVQPSHVWGDREIVGRHLTDDRWVFPYATMGAQGGLVVFGSDAPVADTDPWSGICAAVTRTGVDGAEPWIASETLTVEEAIAAHTSGPALLHRSLGTGALRSGAPADLVVLDRDPFAIPGAELREVRTDMTVSAGEVVYDSTRTTRDSK